MISLLSPRFRLNMPEVALELKRVWHPCFRGFEQLSSLFWRRVMAIYKLGFIHARLEFVGVKILTTFCFLWHNFGSRYARMPN